MQTVWMKARDISLAFSGTMLYINIADCSSTFELSVLSVILYWWCWLQRVLKRVQVGLFRGGDSRVHRILRGEGGSLNVSPGGGGVLPYITYTGMCHPMGSWFWSSWFSTGYPFQRRFLEQGIKNCGSRLYLLLKIVADYEEAFISCISRTNKEISF